MENENENKGKVESIGVMSLATILHGLKFNLKEEMIALSLEEKFNQSKLIDKVDELRNLEKHIKACYEIGSTQIKFEYGKES